MKYSLKDMRRRYMPRSVKWRIVDVLSYARRIKDHKRAKPDFIIIGAQKCGTTFLLSSLCKNPHILPPALKEVHFFDFNYEKGESWYRSMFPSYKEMTDAAARLSSPVVTGEASPFYIYYPHAIDRAWKHVPDARIIAVLRDPVERAVSHYYHSRARGLEELPIEQAFAVEAERLKPEKARIKEDPTYMSLHFGAHSYVDRGHYVQQLKQWERRFPRERMLILDSRSLFADTQSTLDQTCDFLGVKPFRYSGGGEKNVTSAKSDISDSLRRFISDQFIESNEELYRYAGIRF